MMFDKHDCTNWWISQSVLMKMGYTRAGFQEKVNSQRKLNWLSDLFLKLNPVYPISIKTDCEIHQICFGGNGACPHRDCRKGHFPRLFWWKWGTLDFKKRVNFHVCFDVNRDGACPDFRKWWISRPDFKKFRKWWISGNSPLSEMRKCPISIKTNVEIHLFLKSGVPHFHQNRSGNWPFLQCAHTPFPSKQIWKFTFFWNTDIPHFHQNRRGNSPFPEIWCAAFPSKQTWKLTFSAMRTCPICTNLKTDLEFHRFLKCGHAPFPGPSKQTWKWTFSVVLTCTISNKTDLDIHLSSFWNFESSGPDRRGNSPFSEIRCAAFPWKQTWRFTCFWNPDMPHFHQNRFRNSPFSEIRTCPISTKTAGPSRTWRFTFFWNPDMPHWHQNICANSPFSEIWCAHWQLPSKQTWKLTFPAMRTYPICIKR